MWKTQTWCARLVVGWIESKANKVDENHLSILFGGNNIKWVKTFVSSVLSKICFNLLQRFEVEMVFVGSNMKVASMVDDKFKMFDKPDEAENLFFIRIFWSRLQNLFLSRIKFLDETHGDDESDEIVKGLKLLLAYEGNGLGVDGWAMLCKGNEIVVFDLGEKMLTVVNEYEKWKESAIAKGFDKAFKDFHHMLAWFYECQCGLGIYRLAEKSGTHTSAGEEAMPPQLPALANRSLEIAEQLVHLTQQIHSGSLLRKGVTKLSSVSHYLRPLTGAVRLRQPIRRGSLVHQEYVDPLKSFSYSHSALKFSVMKVMTRNSDFQLSDFKFDFFVDVGNKVSDACGEAFSNLSVVLKSNQSSVSAVLSKSISWSRFVRKSSRVLINAVFDRES
nr:protein SIEVE ELEMENT OCCLUSION B-like [Ipomoea batatas]